MQINIKDILTLPIKIYISFLVVAAALLYLPDKILELFHLKTFSDKYSSYIGLAFIILLSMILISLIFNLGHFFKSKISSTKYLKYRTKILENLNNYEKTIIQILYVIPENTLELKYYSGITQQLLSNDIIRPIRTTAIVQDLNNVFLPFGLHPWVISYINNNKDSYFRDIEDLDENEQILLVKKVSDLLNSDIKYNFLEFINNS